MLCDGHGANGHTIADYILAHYPDLLAKLLIAALEEYRAFSGSLDEI